MRAGKQSAGIQLTPRTQIRSPLTRRANCRPSGSSLVSRSMTRKPTRPRGVVVAHVAVGDLDVELVQLLFAVAHWPPASDVGNVDGEGDAAAGVGGDLAVPDDVAGRRRDRCTHRRRGVVSRLDLEVDDHVEVSRFASRRCLGRQSCGRTDGADPHTRPALQLHRSPQPRCRQLRPPVPPEVAGHLAYEVVRPAVGVGEVTGPVALRCGVRYRGVERDHQLVAGAIEQPGHVEAIRAVLVLGAAKRRPVECDGGESVDALEHQRCPQVVGLGIEREAVGPRRFADPLQGELVAIDVRVVDQPGGEQVEMHAAGHRRRHAGRAARFEPVEVTAEVEHPAVVQRRARGDRVASELHQFPLSSSGDPLSSDRNPMIY